MRKAYLLLLLLAPSAVIYACGGTSSDNLDAGGDAGGDTTTQGDSASDTGTGDTGAEASSDAGQDVVTHDVVTVNVTCLYPYQCVDGGEADAAYPPSNSNDVCCGTLVTTTSGQTCSFVSLTTQCASPGSCASNEVLGCGTDTIRGCKHQTECTENGYDKCCLFEEGDGGAQFCVSDELATFATSCVPTGK